MARERSGAISGPNPMIGRARSGAVTAPPPRIGLHRGPPTNTVHFDPAGMENARLGVVYLFSKIEPIPNIMSVAIEGILGIASQGMDNTGKAVVDGVKTVSTTVGGATEKIVAGNARSATQAFADWAKGIVQKLWAEIRAKFQEPKFIVGELKGLINAFVRLFAKEVAPFVKGVMDMVKGLAKAAPLIITKIKTWMHGRHVTLIRVIQPSPSTP